MTDLREDELVLLVLGIIDKPLQGKVVLQNEVFLFYQELRDKLGIVDPEFKPCKYGLFSTRIDETVKLLETLGYIEIYNKRYRRLARYVLTEEGKELAKQIIERLRKKLGDEHIEKLKKLRQGLDELGHDGILRYIHYYYPEHATRV